MLILSDSRISKGVSGRSTLDGAVEREVFFKIQSSIEDTDPQCSGITFADVGKLAVQAAELQEM